MLGDLGELTRLREWCGAESGGSGGWVCDCQTAGRVGMNELVFVGKQMSAMWACQRRLEAEVVGDAGLWTPTRVTSSAEQQRDQKLHTISFSAHHESETDGVQGRAKMG